MMNKINKVDCILCGNYDDLYGYDKAITQINANAGPKLIICGSCVGKIADGFNLVLDVLETQVCDSCGHKYELSDTVWCANCCVGGLEDTIESLAEDIEYLEEEIKELKNG